MKKGDMIDIGSKYYDILKGSGVPVYCDGVQVKLISCAQLMSIVKYNGETKQVYTSSLRIPRSSIRLLDKLIKKNRKEDKKKQKQEKEYQQWGKDNLPSVFFADLD